jgi:hypothetical protein
MSGNVDGVSAALAVKLPEIVLKQQIKYMKIYLQNNIFFDQPANYHYKNRTIGVLKLRYIIFYFYMCTTECDMHVN